MNLLCPLRENMALDSFSNLAESSEILQFPNTFFRLESQCTKLKIYHTWWTSKIIGIIFLFLPQTSRLSPSDTWPFIAIIAITVLTLDLSALQRRVDVMRGFRCSFNLSSLSRQERRALCPKPLTHSLLNHWLPCNLLFQSSKDEGLEGI